MKKYYKPTSPALRCVVPEFPEGIPTEGGLCGKSPLLRCHIRDKSVVELDEKEIAALLKRQAAQKKALVESQQTAATNQKQ